MTVGFETMTFLPQWRALSAKLTLGSCVALLLVLYVALLWFSAASQGNIHTGDTDNLAAGTRTALDCIHLGEFTRCGFFEGTRQSSVFPYPLLQYLPAAVFIKAGASNDHAVELLARLNIVAFGLSFIFAWVVLRRRKGMWPLACAAVLAGTATYQSTAGFGEMLAGTTILGALAAARSRRWWLIAAAFTVACIGKETFPPFVLALGLIVARDDHDGWLPSRARLLPMTLGTMLGFGLSAAFNVFRFGTPRNLSYLDPELRTPGLWRKASFVVAQWLSPNAGIVWFWPVATLLLLLCGTVGVQRVIRGKPLDSWAWPVAVVAVAFAFTIALTFWYTPFGWIAYGPRLATPLLPAAVVAALYVTAGPIRSLVGCLARVPALFATLVVVVALSGWPQYGAPWTNGAAVEDLIAADASCPRMTDFAIQGDKGFYYRCATHMMWRIEPGVLDDAATGGSIAAMVARAVGALATAGAVAAVAKPTSIRRSRPAAKLPRRSPAGTALG